MIVDHEDEASAFCQHPMKHHVDMGFKVLSVVQWSGVLKHHSVDGKVNGRSNDDVWCVKDGAWSDFAAI